MVTSKSPQRLPSFIDTYPIDLHLRIYPQGAYFKAELRVSGSRPVTFTIPLSPADVADLNMGLQQEIATVFGNCPPDGIDDNALATLATAGQAAFHRVFSNGIPRRTINDALKLLHPRSLPTIEITAENFFLPWEILYTGSLNRAAINNFWGMRYCISRTIVQEASPGSLVPPEIETTQPYVGMVVCDELDNVVQNEIPNLQNLAKDARIELAILRPLDVTKQQRELEYFGRFLSNKRLHILHFACHAYNQEPVDQSYLRISNTFKVTRRDFFAREFATKNNPLVILNACHTGVTDPQYTSNWAALFWQAGARGVLATEFQVPDAFAAAFVAKLYPHLLAGTPIGEALLLTRRMFWERHRAPLGLAYALYSPLAIRLVGIS